MVDMGVPGFKCFLIHSGVEEFPAVTREQVEEALLELRGTGAVLLFHAEERFQFRKCCIDRTREILLKVKSVLLFTFRVGKIFK